MSNLRNLLVLSRIEDASPPDDAVVSKMGGGQVRWYVRMAKVSVIFSRRPIKPSFPSLQDPCCIFNRPTRTCLCSIELLERYVSMIALIACTKMPQYYLYT